VTAEDLLKFMREEFIEIVDETAAVSVTDNKAFRKIQEVTEQNTKEANLYLLSPNKRMMKKKCLHQLTTLLIIFSGNIEICQRKEILLTKRVVSNAKSQWAMNPLLDSQLWTILRIALDTHQ
jgi:hypothetical protein